MCENRYSLLSRCPKDCYQSGAAAPLHSPAPSLPFSASGAKRKEPAGLVLGNNYPPLGRREAALPAQSFATPTPPPSSLHLEQPQSSPGPQQHGSLEQELVGQLHHRQQPCRPSAVPGASLAEAQPHVFLSLASGPPGCRGPWRPWLVYVSVAGAYVARFRGS